jgi:hypothetical protein
MNIHQFFYELFRLLSILSNKVLEGSEIDENNATILVLANAVKMMKRNSQSKKVML